MPSPKSSLRSSTIRTTCALALTGALLSITRGSVGCAREAKGPSDATGADGGTKAPAAPETATPDATETPVDSPDTKSDVQKQFDAFVAERNACTSTADCTLVSPGCPLGCGTGVRSEHAEAVNAKAAALIAEAERDGGACAYRCAALHVECVEARCTAIVE
jgi:hypothetical protein